MQIRLGMGCCGDLINFFNSSSILETEGIYERRDIQSREEQYEAQDLFFFVCLCCTTATEYYYSCTIYSGERF